MSSDFFVNLYLKTHRRYTQGLKSQIAREMFQIGTKYGEPAKGFSFGLSSKFVNTIEETPRSTKNLIVVPWMAEKEFDYETTTYDKLSFDADVVDYKISLEEFDAVVNDLKKCEYWIPQYTFPMSIWLGMLIVPFILMALFAVVVGHGFSSTHPILFIAIVILCPLLALINFLSPLFVHRANLSRLDSREAEFERILMVWNHRIFFDRKVKWKCGKYGCWIELHFDKELKGLEAFNLEIIEKVKEDLQDEYVEEAKRLKVNVDGQRVQLGAVGCERNGVQRVESGTGGSAGQVSRSSTFKSMRAKRVSSKAVDREVGHAIAAGGKSGDDGNGDLEIRNVHLGRPLIKSVQQNSTPEG